MSRLTIGDAMHKAEEALNQIASHERVCSLRYEGIEKAHLANRDATNGIKAQVDKIVFLVVTTLLTSLGATLGMIFILLTK